MKNLLYLTVVALGFALSQLSCNPNTSKKAEVSTVLSADTLMLATEQMQEFVDSGKWAGIYTLIFKDGKVVHREMAGYADLENKKPVEENSIYRIFSMTKPVTAVALMTLFDEGKFQLDDPLSEYIPEFKNTMVYNPDGEGSKLEKQVNEISIRHLLTHTSGIPYGWDQNSYVDSLYRVTGAGGWDSGSIGDKVKIIAQLPLKFQPGTRYEYGLSIDVAGYLVEVLSGLPLDEFFKTRIFGPLKMVDTDFYVPEEKHNRLVNLYYRDREGALKSAGKWGNRIKDSVTVFSGGGGLVSTMDDYLSFCRMLLNGGELNGNRILEESTADLIMSDQLPEAVEYKDEQGYGLGGAVHLTKGLYMWGGAASTNFWIDPGNEMIIIAYAQLMPDDHSYAYDFREWVYRALITE